MTHTGDPDHARVHDALFERMRGGVRAVTTNLVLAETHALLLHRIHRSAALAFLRTVGQSPTVVVTSSPELEIRARRDWLERFNDQDFSLADAVSFAVMAERGIREALTLDRHFAAAGFVTVPGPG